MMFISKTIVQLITGGFTYKKTFAALTGPTQHYFGASLLLLLLSRFSRVRLCATP